MNTINDDRDMYLRLVSELVGEKVISCAGIVAYQTEDAADIGSGAKCFGHGEKMNGAMLAQMYGHALGSFLKTVGEVAVAVQRTTKGEMTALEFHRIVASAANGGSERDVGGYTFLKRVTPDSK